MTWDEKIKDFENFLRFERNFSDNTLDAYLRDVRKLRDFAEFDMNDTGPLVITYENIQEFLFHISKKKFSERTQARRISSIKAFLKYLVEDEAREDNPATLLEGPKLGLYLPDTLSFDDVNRIIKAINISTDLGRRNHCMIEVLYGCGLRVSELIDLKISNIRNSLSF